MKKKVIACILVASTLLGFSACSSTAKWHEEAKNAVADKFAGEDCGEFYLEGEVYHLPCKVSEFLDNGWKFNNNKETTINAHDKSEYYYDVSKDNKTIQLGYTNNTNDTLDIKDAEVDYINLSESSGRVATAGDLELYYQKFNDEDDFFKFLGFKEEDFQSSKVGTDTTEYTYFYSNADNYDSNVTFKLTKGNDGKFIVDTITYACDYYYDFGAEVEAVVNSIIYDDASYLDPVLTMIVSDYNGDFDPESYVYGQRSDIADFIIYNLGFDVTFYDLSENDQKVFFEFCQAVFDKIDFECSYDKESNNITFVYSTVDIVPALIESYNEACLSYEGELDEQTWFIDEAFLSHYVNSVDSSYSFEMLPEKTFVIDSDSDYLYYQILINLIGLGDYYTTN